MEINIIDMYPDILNIYGDIGNLQILKQRCLWRNIDVNIHSFTKGKNFEIDTDNIDIILVGGGSDNAQKIVSNHLIEQKNKLEDFIENNGIVLAICGSYQMFGNEYLDVKGNPIPCLGIFDIETKSNANRLIGNIVLENNLNIAPSTLIGFENHGGRTYHDYKTLGTVKSGNGNNGEDNEEGIVYKNFIGTYLHGPLLPKNPHLADKLILEALKEKYDIDSLAPLDDTIELNAHENIVKKIINK